MSNQPLRAPRWFREGHVNSSRSVTSAKNDTSPGCHVDGVGETLVFSLKTSHQLKTGGLCTVPYPGVDKVKVKVNVGVKVNIRRRLGEATPSACIAEARRRQEEASPR